MPVAGDTKASDVTSPDGIVPDLAVEADAISRDISVEADSGPAMRQLWLELVTPACAQFHDKAGAELNKSFCAVMRAPDI